MTNVTFECILVTDENGEEIQMFRATLGERVTYGRNRAQCLEEMAYRLRKTEHESVFHGEP